MRWIMTAGAAAAAAVVWTGSALVVQDPAPPEAPGSTTEEAWTAPERIACSSAITRGVLADVAPAGQGRVSVTIRVADWLKPQQGRDQVTVTVVDGDLEVEKPWVPGSEVLVTVFVDPEREPDVFTGDAIAPAQRNLEAYLVQARDKRCPSG